MRIAFSEWVGRYWQFLGLAVLYLVQAGFYSAQVLFKFVDSDQLVMADMTSFYAQGVIPEPYFWGQNYLFPLESWLGVPFVFFGARADLTLSFIALTLFYVPYLLVTHIALRAKKPILAFLIGVIPFLLPPEYLISAMIPRNFGTTSALAAVSVIALSLSNQKSTALIFGLLLGVCFASNPATAILAPTLLLALKNKRYLYWIPATGLGAGAILLLGQYYRIHPEAVRYFPEPIAVSLRQFKTSLTTPDILTPPFLILLLALAPIAYAIWRSTPSTRKIMFWVAAGIGAFVLLFFATDRINSFTASPFYSSFRFWTVIPLLATVFGVSASLSPIPDLPTPRWIRTVLLPLLLILACAGNAWALSSQKTTLLSQPNPADLSPRSQVVEICDEISSTIDKSTQFIELNAYNPWMMQGCVTMNDVIVTFPDKDRRTWLPEFTQNHGLVRVYR